MLYRLMSVDYSSATSFFRQYPEIKEWGFKIEIHSEGYYSYATIEFDSCEEFTTFLNLIEVTYDEGYVIIGREAGESLRTLYIYDGCFE